MEEQQIFVRMAIKAWDTQIGRADKFFSSVSDESMFKEVAPGKNRIIYLLGHLIVANDSMISIFGLGERKYAHLEEAFMTHPDKSDLDMPEISVLRNDWAKSNRILSDYFSKLTTGEWMSRHTVMTDEDFAKDPGRNKLSVLLNRTNHVAYHLGQLVLA